MYKNIVRAGIILLISLFVVCTIGCNDPVSSPDYQPPRSLEAELIDFDVELNWDASVSGEETEYEVWRATADKGEYELLTYITDLSTSYNDTSAELNQSYSYKIRSMYSGEVGVFGDEVTISTGLILYAVEHFYGNASVFNPETGVRDGDIPLPGKDRGGIAFDGEYLYSACWKYDTIYKIDPTTNVVVSTFPSPSESPVYLTFDGTYLWIMHLIFGEQVGTLTRVNVASGSTIASYTITGIFDGIAYDDENILVMDNGNHRILKLNAENGSTVSTTICDYEFYGITYYNGWLFGVEDNVIRCVDMDSGDELYSFNGQQGNSMIIGLEMRRY